MLGQPTPTFHVYGDLLHTRLYGDVQRRLRCGANDAIHVEPVSFLKGSYGPFQRLVKQVKRYRRRRHEIAGDT